MFRGKPDVGVAKALRGLSFGCFMVLLALTGGLAMNSHADYSNRRQIIVFTEPGSVPGESVERSVDALRCELVERDTDVRMVDISELPDTSTTATSESRDNERILFELVKLRGSERPDFELVLIGKDGGVKARTSDPNALEDFLALIDSMPMRRAEMRSKGSHDGPCDDRQ